MSDSESRRDEYQDDTSNSDANSVEFPKSINHQLIPTKANWLAQDASGTWWAYEVEPLQFDKGWYENELGERWLIIKSSPPKDFKQQLIKL